jgi:hypothetical protein
VGRAWIEAARVEHEPPKGYRSKVLALDPADGNQDGAEQAWCLAGSALDLHLYVIESEGMRVSPLQWLKAAIHRAREAEATILVEKNHGGRYLVELLETAMKEIGTRVAYRTIDASQGKTTRAEPVAMLYEQGYETDDPKVHHVGNHSVLEDQMCLAGGTLVKTAQGDVPIERVRVGDRVWTRAGLRRVKWSGQTGVRQTLALRTSDGDLLLTPEHPVYAEGRGFRPASQSDLQSRIAAWPSRDASTVMRRSRPRRAGAGRVLSVSAGAIETTRASNASESFIEGSATTATTRATSGRAARTADSSCTGSSGKRRMGRSPMGGMSTIETETPATIGWKTLWRSVQRAMSRSMGRGGSATGTRSVGARRGARHGNVVSRASSPAASAAKRSSRPQCASPTTARESAATERWAVVERLETGPVVPVYNLTVEDQPEFFANGLLVHNCNFTGAPGEKSPDRLDACVWAIRDLMGYNRTPSEDPWNENKAVPWGGNGHPVGGAVSYR